MCLTLPYFHTYFLKISGSSSDAGAVERRSAQRTQEVNGKGSKEQEGDYSSRVPQLGGGKSEAAVNGESNQEDTKNDSAAPTRRKTIPSEGEQRGSVTDFQEPRKPPDDQDGGYLPLRAPRGGDGDSDHDQNVGSLDMDNQSSFQIDDDRNSPQGLSSYRPDRAGRGSLSGDDGRSLFSPQPFEEPEDELSIDGGMYDQHLLPLQSQGDRCSTRGNQQERAVRGGGGLGRVTPRARSQVGWFIDSRGTVKTRANARSPLCKLGWRLYHRFSARKECSALGTAGKYLHSKEVASKYVHTFFKAVYAPHHPIYASPDGRGMVCREGVEIAAHAEWTPGLLRTFAGNNRSA